MVDSHPHPPQVSGDQQNPAVRCAVQQGRFAEALLRNGGGRAWRAWKAGQMEEVMQDLALVSPRIELLHIELAGDLELVYGVEMPVPLAPALRSGKTGPGRARRAGARWPFWLHSTSGTPTWLPI